MTANERKQQKKEILERVNDIVCSLLLRPSYVDTDIKEIIEDAYAIEHKIREEYDY